MIRFRTLGTLNLGHAEGPELRAVLSQPRRVALLAYLAVGTPHGFHRRDRLLALFWPESDAEHARASLNRAIYFLRRELGEGTIISRGDQEVCVNSERFWCDAAAFDQALAEGQAREALELYRGDLLPGFFTSNANGFEEWLENERARLRDRASEAAWALAENEEARGSLPHAAHWARRGVELAPFREVGFRRLLALLDRAGDRAGAAYAYRKFAAEIATELELAPSPETRALIDGIRARDNAELGSAGESRKVSSASILVTAAETAQRVDAEPPHHGVARSEPRPRSSWTRWTAVAGAALAILATVALGLISKAGGGYDPHRVYIAAFVNRTGDHSLDLFARLASDQITRVLTNAGLAEVVAPYADDSAAAKVDSSPRSKIASANDRGAGIVVSGEIYAEEGRVHVLARITDARRRRVLWVVQPGSAPTGSSARAVDEVCQRTVGAVAALMSPRFATWLPLATSPPTFAAFQEFAQGTELQLRGEPREAVAHFRSAVALDPSFTWALMQRAVAHMNMGQSGLADSISEAMSRVPERLTPLQRHWLEWMLAMRAEDRVRALGAMRAAARIAPARFLYGVADNASYINHPKEVIDALVRLGPNAPFDGGSGGYWYHLTNAYHLLGHHSRELSVAHRGRMREPDRVSALTFYIPALAALGRVDQLWALLDTSLTLPNDLGSTPGEVMVLAGEELRAHGHAAAGAKALARAVAWYRTHDPGDNEDAAFRSNFGRALYQSRDWLGAEAVFRSLLLGDSTNAYYVGFLGAIAARRGDRAAAEQVVAKLEAMKPTLSRPRSIGWWQGKIVALLGDDARAMRFMADALGSQGRGESHTDFDFEGMWGSKLFREFIRPKG